MIQTWKAALVTSALLWLAFAWAAESSAQDIAVRLPAPSGPEPRTPEPDRPAPETKPDYVDENCGRFRKRPFSCIARSEAPDRQPSATWDLISPFPAPLLSYAAAPSLELAVAGGELAQDLGELSLVRPLGVGRFAWVPLSDVIDGSSVADDWIDLAARGTAFECGETFCSRFVPALLDDENEKSVAVCRVPKQNTESPLHCRLILWQSDEDTYVSAPATLSESSYTAWMARRDFTIRLEFPDHKTDATDAARKHMSEVFRSQNYIVNVYRDNIVAYADNRRHKELGLWANETIQAMPTQEVESGIEYAIATNLLVSKRNTLAVREFRPASWYESERFLTYLRHRIRNYFASVCEDSKLVPLGTNSYGLECAQKDMSDDN